MLTLIYDQYATPYADGNVNAVVLDCINLEKSINLSLRFSTSNILNAFRVAIMENRIPRERVVIQYEDYAEDQMSAPRLRTLTLYTNGGIKPWPKGFADFDTERYRDILRLQQDMLNERNASV